MTGGYSPVRKLAATDRVDAFDCGHDDVVVGICSLAVGSADPASAPARVMKGLARHAVPVMLLARLAVDLAHQRKGLGQALLKDALLRTIVKSASAPISIAPFVG